MWPRAILGALMLATAFAPQDAAGILDLFDWDEKVEMRQDGDSPTRSCLCNGPSCMCCVDFNLTYIDLGGPGCVQMKYISQEEGLTVNVSYGDSLLHSEHVKGPNPEPTCMPLLANFAEICARFRELVPNEEGLRGCVALEPKLLGEISSRFDIGCFKMGPEGMLLENTTAYTEILQGASNLTQSETDEFNEEDLLAAVNETAQQGLAFFGSLLGLNISNQPDKNSTTSTIENSSENQSTGSRFLNSVS